MLWTIVAPESLIRTELETPPQKIIHYYGVPVLVESAAGNRYKIKQVLSTNPNDYLDGRLQPDTFLPSGAYLGEQPS